MKKRKWWIMGLGLIVLLAIAIMGAEIYLKKRIKEELHIQTVYGDTLRISNIDLGLLGGWMDLNDLVLRWNIDQEDELKQPSTYLIQGHIGKIHLKGLNFFKYLLIHQIFIRELLIDSSALDIYFLQDAAGAYSPAKNTTVTRQKPLVIDISGIRIAPSRIRYFENEKSSASLEVGQLSMEMDGFHYPVDPEVPAPIEYFSWNAQDLRYGKPADYSDLIIAEAGGNSKDSSLSFSHLRFLPRFSKAEYSQRLKNKNSRVAVDVAQAELTGMNWLTLLTTGKISARKFALDNYVIEVYEDSRLPVDETRYKSLYQEKLLNLGLTIAVDSVLLYNGKLNYQIRPEYLSSELGFLDFLTLEATITNITNDSVAIAANPLMRANINTVLNGESKLTTYFTFDLSSPNAAYTYSGEMHKFELPKFNTILMETSRMKITEGVMQRMTFEVNADKYRAQGEMRIDYSGLKMEWLEEHNFFTALAQKVVMREDNPKNGNYRVGQIYFERLPYKSFWNYYAKSLLSGLSSTAIPNLLLPKELDAKKEKK